VVVIANAVVYPRTVVVEPLDTTVADIAVLASLSLYELTIGT